MFKRFMQWILPFIVLVVLAAYLILSPVLAPTHAAAPAHPAAPTQHMAAPDDANPNAYWHP